MPFVIMSGKFRFLVHIYFIPHPHVRNTISDFSLISGSDNFQFQAFSGFIMYRTYGTLNM